MISRSSVIGIASVLSIALLAPACGQQKNGTDHNGEIREIPQDSLAFYPTPLNSEIPSYEGYALVWSDEFNGDSLSEDWTFEEGFQRNNELQWYQPQNASVKDGCLVIEGRSERVKNPNYDPESGDWTKNREYAEFTSSCVTTQNRKDFKYGRFEVRAKIPTVSGSWPAIWLLGNQWQWPANGEIDMMEYYQRDGVSSILANACWGADKRHSAPVWDDSITPFTHFTSKDPEWADKFHIWKMDWDEKTIKLYLDEELLNEIDLAETFNGGLDGNTENPFSNDVEGFGDYILLNLAIGSNGGEPDLKAFPLHYLVDYVRVYQPVE